MIILWILIAFLIVSLVISIYFTFLLMNVKAVDNEVTWKRGLADGWFSKEFLDTSREEFTINPETDQIINGSLIDNGSDKTIVFVHGHTGNWLTMVKYFYYFIRADWNIVAFDNRGHGKSHGGKTSYGYKEKFDLIDVISWVRKRFPESKILGVLGESLGAATVMEYSAIDIDINFIIADCGYSDFKELLFHQLKYRSIPAFLKYPVFFFTNILIRIFLGFWIYQVSPKRAILSVKTPLLLFHGGADDYVPTSMSQDIYDLRKDKAITELLIVPEAGHAKSILVDRDAYEQKVDHFLKSIEKGNCDD